MVIIPHFPFCERKKTKSPKKAAAALSPNFHPRPLASGVFFRYDKGSSRRFFAAALWARRQHTARRAPILIQKGPCTPWMPTTAIPPDPLFLFTFSKGMALPLQRERAVPFCVFSSTRAGEVRLAPSQEKRRPEPGQKAHSPKRSGALKTPSAKDTIYL